MCVDARPPGCTLSEISMKFLMHNGDILNF